MAGEIISERRATSNRNGERDHPGIPGDFSRNRHPFVFLTLFMSAEAAFATPLILMSQNRSAERDREHAQHDYEVNVEAKREIEELITTLARIEIDKLDKIMAVLKV
jgi:uncharacterized membrane protein